MDWGHAALDSFGVEGRSILEVGSLWVNGSLHDLYPYADWTGTDMRPGPNVDVVIDGGDLLPYYSAQAFDIVVMTEVLEHAQDWQTVLHNAKQMVAPGGLLIVTTRSPGFPRHDHPADHWRFTPDLMVEALGDMAAVNVWDDPEAPGVFAEGWGPAGDHDPVWGLLAEPAPA